jgi:hypothetical protein
LHIMDQIVSKVSHSRGVCIALCSMYKRGSCSAALSCLSRPIDHNTSPRISC